MLVLCPVQTAHDQGAFSPLHFLKGFGKVAVDPFGKNFSILGGQGILLLRGHLTELDLVGCIVPRLRGGPVLEEIDGKSIQPQLALLRLRTMAIHAMGLENRTDVLLVGVRGWLSGLCLQVKRPGQQAEGHPKKVCFSVRKHFPLSYPNPIPCKRKKPA